MNEKKLRADIKCCLTNGWTLKEFKYEWNEYVENELKAFPELYKFMKEVRS